MRLAARCAPQHRCGRLRGRPLVPVGAGSRGGTRAFVSASCSTRTCPTATLRPRAGCPRPAERAASLGLVRRLAWKAAGRRLDGCRWDRKPHLAGRAPRSPPPPASGRHPTRRDARVVGDCSRGRGCCIAPPLRHLTRIGQMATAPPPRLGRRPAGAATPGRSRDRHSDAPGRAAGDVRSTARARPGHRRIGSRGGAGDDGQHCPATGARDCPVRHALRLRRFVTCSAGWPHASISRRRVRAPARRRARSSETLCSWPLCRSRSGGWTRRDRPPATPRAWSPTERSLVSSANWSAAGLGGNWEVAMRVEHPAAAAYYAAAWRRDWETGLRIDV